MDTMYLAKQILAWLMRLDDDEYERFLRAVNERNQQLRAEVGTQQPDSEEILPILRKAETTPQDMQ